MSIIKNNFISLQLQLQGLAPYFLPLQRCQNLLCRIQRHFYIFT